jgi:carbon monoxide dehydrogenase subunit G
MRQEFHETLTVAQPPGAVWAVVSRIPTVLSWISIVEQVEETAPDRYRVVLADRLGPFKLRADLEVGVTERVEPRSIRAHGDGEDRQIGSRLIVDVALELAELAEGRGEQLELVRAEGDVLQGRLKEGLRQVKAAVGAGGVSTIVEVAPWSRIPEARALLVPRDD